MTVSARPGYVPNADLRRAVVPLIPDVLTWSELSYRVLGRLDTSYLQRCLGVRESAPSGKRGAGRGRQCYHRNLREEMAVAIAAEFGFDPYEVGL